jgi:class 3 adenylate cyclase
LEDTAKPSEIPPPDLAKYTGDGALLLWVRDNGEKFSGDFCTSVVAALRHFQLELPSKVAEWERQWKVSELPKIARVGVATGPVHPLLSKQFWSGGETVDYAGYCINLAVRLQDHCREVGFIVHYPLRPQLIGLEEFRAVKMKGSMDELVYVFYEDWRRAEARGDRAIVQSRFSPVEY